MNHANHSTVLVYAHEGGELEVGTVTCVPRKGEIVELLVDGAYVAHRVEQVSWACGVDVTKAGPTFYGARFTVVRCSLSRCP